MNYQERKMFIFLHQLFPGDKIYTHYRPDWLKNPKTNRNLEIDLYFPDLKIGIEINGKYHRFVRQIRRDVLKRTLCQEFGVKLFSINVPYSFREMFKIKRWIQKTKNAHNKKEKTRLKLITRQQNNGQIDE